MATHTDQGSAVTVQSVLPASLAEQLKAEAERSSRSVSNLIKVAVQERLRADQGRKA